jgi:hypothetical protein
VNLKDVSKYPTYLDTFAEHVHNMDIYNDDSRNLICEPTFDDRDGDPSLRRKRSFVHKYFE